MGDGIRLVRAPHWQNAPAVPQDQQQWRCIQCSSVCALLRAHFSDPCGVLMCALAACHWDVNKDNVIKVHWENAFIVCTLTVFFLALDPTEQTKPGDNFK